MTSLEQHDILGSQGFSTGSSTAAPRVGVSAMVGMFFLSVQLSTDIYGQIELSGRQWKLARLQLERIYEPNTYTQNYFERFFSFLSFLFSSKLFQNLSGGRLHMAAKFSFGP